MVCADNTVVIPMRACDRGKSEARGARSAEGAPCEGRFVVHVESSALTGTHVQKLGTLVGVAIRSREDHSDEKITHHEVGWSPLRNHPINVRGGQVSDWEESQMLAALSR